MHSDPLADALARLQNAAQARHSFVRMPASKLKKVALETLARRGFLGKVSEKKEGKFLELEAELLPARKGSRYRRISKPGRRVFTPAKDLRPVLDGFGLAILSTSQGVMTGDEARKKNLGGEVLFEVW